MLVTCFRTTRKHFDTGFDAAAHLQKRRNLREKDLRRRVRYSSEEEECERLLVLFWRLRYISQERKHHVEAVREERRIRYRGGSGDGEYVPVRD